MKNTALIIVDFQNDYFEDFKDAKFVLENTLEASTNAGLLLRTFREKDIKVIHVQHESLSQDAPFFITDTEGFDIHKSVAPVKGEAIIVKNHANSFLNTSLQDVLETSNIQDVIICGAMSHICVNSTVRAASDLNYNCTVVHDACATLALEFEGEKINAAQVHASSMATLGFGFAKTVSTKEILDS